MTRVESQAVAKTRLGLGQATQREQGAATVVQRFRVGGENRDGLIVFSQGASGIIAGGLQAAEKVMGLGAPRRGLGELGIKRVGIMPVQAYVSVKSGDVNEARRPAVS